ncbi:hypothetical protein [Paenibacillus wenxiniae]|uniref:Uncharacterized protein n=1 Tax=Paenibacillus wenxiniae TaxID=1636843 RepID=A0ABW4REN2_9BACL
MSTKQWTMQDWQIASGSIQATVRPFSGADSQKSQERTFTIAPLEPKQLQLMLEKLSLSALLVELLLRTELPARSGKNSSSSARLSIWNLQLADSEDEEEAPAAERLLACTPYVSEPWEQWLSRIADPKMQDDAGLFILKETHERLREHPLLAWKLAGLEREQLQERIWKLWRGDMLIAPEATSEQLDEVGDEGVLSDEPSLGSLLAESAAAGTLHQVGELLADVQAYLEQDEPAWEVAASKAPVFGASEDEQQQLPDLSDLLPEIPAAPNGYEEIRRRIAERTRQRHAAARRGKT